jgi:TolB-like protein/DNA-binding winged helix-turn-helix (wHTH) protein
MPSPAEKSRIVHFGLFEVDLQEQELRKSGIRIKLQQQPFQLLSVLLEHPGQTVTRGDLRQRLWPTDTFVDFDHSLNSSVKKLRQALGDDSDNPRFIETLHRRGYRFIAPVDGPSTPIEPQGRGTLVAQTPLATPSKRSYRRIIGVSLVILASLAALLVAFNLGHWRDRMVVRDTAPRIQSLAVLPLENLSHDPQQEYFADGMTEELITDLSKIKTLKVISRTSVMQYKAVKKSLPQIARELGVDAVIEGSVQRVGDHVRITAQLIHADTDTHLWAQNYDRDLRDTLALEDRVARDIANEIKVQLTPEEQLRLTTSRKVDPLAQAAYLKGRYFINRFNEPDFVKCAQYLEEATKRDPSYAEAYAALATCYELHGWMQPPKEIYPKVKAAALKSLEIDNSLSEGHQALGFAMLFFDWDWAGSERELKKAIDEDPSSALAHQWYSLRLLFAGRLDEGIAEAKKSVEVDPASLMMSRCLAWNYLYAHRFDEAIAQGKATLEMDPANPDVRAIIADAYAFKGSKPLSGKDLLVSMEDYQRKVAKRHYVDPVKIAAKYGQLGDKESAFKWLAKGYETRSNDMVHIKISPYLDPLRSDPRFQDLMRRMNFPQ